MAADGGFAFLWLSVTPVGKRVSLFVVAATPNAMLCMTTTSVMVQKAAFGRSKSPAFAGTKTAANRGPSPSPPESPSPSLPKGRELLLAVFEVVMWCSFLLGEGWDGLLCWMVRTPGNSVGVAIS